jgi:hypothetical protein
MLTPEEKKSFKQLRAISKTAQLGNFEWEFEDLDWNEDKYLSPSVEIFKDDDVYRSGKNLNLPDSIAKSIHSYYMREVAPKIESTLDEVIDSIPDDPSMQKLWFVFDIKNQDIKSWVEVGYYETQDWEGGDWSEDEDPEAAPIFETLRQLNPEADSFMLSFEGGGDSGSLADKIESKKDGNHIGSYDVPTIIQSWCYNALPGGWEIDAGSWGVFTFDCENRNINLETQYSQYEEMSKDIIEESFQ